MKTVLFLFAFQLLTTKVVHVKNAGLVSEFWCLSLKDGVPVKKMIGSYRLVHDSCGATIA